MPIKSLRFWCTLIFAGTLILIQAPVSAQRAIPDDNLAYPVLITLKSGGTGSGFYLNTATATYLVTASHVLFDTRSNPKKLRSDEGEFLSYPKDPTDAGRNVLVANLSKLEMDGNIKLHTSQDVALVKIATIVGEPQSDLKRLRLNFVDGVYFKESSPNGVLGVSVDSVKPFDAVLIANDVIVFGYPSSLGLQQIPQFDPSRPLLRRGIVAEKIPQTRSIIIDCPSYPGNSGGPVIEIDDQFPQRYYRVIGVVREYVPFVETWSNAQLGSYTTLLNSGYSVVTPMDPVLELVKQ